MNLTYFLAVLIISICVNNSTLTPITIPHYEWNGDGNIIDLSSLGNLDIKDISFDHLNLNAENLGTNVCGCQKQAPRPHTKHSHHFPDFPTLPPPHCSCSCKSKDPKPDPFKPIGDCCSCGKQLVKPAPLSKIGSPASLVGSSKPSCGCGNAVRAPDDYQIFSPEAASIYFDSGKPKEPVEAPVVPPADVVSISLARRLAESQKNTVHEKNLNFGHLKEPVDGSEKQEYREIDEENLHRRNGPTLELKNSIFHPPETVETMEESEEKVVEEKSQFVPNKLNYYQIGYQPSDPNSPSYIVVPSRPELQESKPKPCNKHKYHISDPTNPQPSDCGCAKNLVVDLLVNPNKRRHHSHRHHHESSVPSLTYNIT